MELQPETMNGSVIASAAAAVANAKFKLMSAAKLPISRSKCIANPNHKHSKPKLPIWDELVPIWWLLVMLMIGVVVVACGGAIKGQ